jgi:hypothetical protein
MTSEDDAGRDEGGEPVIGVGAEPGGGGTSPLLELLVPSTLGTLTRVCLEGIPQEVERVFLAVEAALAFAGEDPGKDLERRAE